MHIHILWAKLTLNSQSRQHLRTCLNVFLNFLKVYRTEFPGPVLWRKGNRNFCPIYILHIYCCQTSHDQETPGICLRKSAENVVQEFWFSSCEYLASKSLQMPTACSNKVKMMPCKYTDACGMQLCWLTSNNYYKLGLARMETKTVSWTTVQYLDLYIHQNKNVWNESKFSFCSTTSSVCNQNLS